MPVRLEVRRADQSSPAISLASLRVVEQDGHHLRAKAMTQPVSTVDLTEGDPVEVTWGHSGAPTTSLMYVHRAPHGAVAQGVSFNYDLTLVGATWPLKSSRQRVFTRQKASTILAQVAAEHGLSHHFDAVDRTFGTFVSRSSDWEALRDLAKRVGGLLRVDATTVRIVDVNWGLQYQYGAPVYEVGSYQFGRATPVSRRADHRRRRVLAMNPSTKTLAEVDDTSILGGTPLLLDEHPIMAMSSPADTREDLLAARRREYFTEESEVTSVSGSPSLRVASLVGFYSTSAEQNGYWTITRAEHQLTSDDQTYTTALSLGRGQDHPRSVARGSALAMRPADQNVSTPRIRNRRWVSA